jgi:peptidoglycan/xylan/chitin deacetylase (PgdA/CDA1 family)
MTNSPVNEKSVTHRTKLSSNDSSAVKALSKSQVNYGIPVLCYHDVNPTTGNELLLHPNKFRKQMQYLKDHGYTPLSMDQLYSFLKEDGALPEKPVVLTFDDGYVGNYTYAFPVLKEFGFNATIFIISDCIDLGPYMTSEQIKEMTSYGIDIESHTTNHCDLSKMNLTAQTNNLKSSKEKLEHLINKPVDYLAYPYGKYNMDTRKAAAAAGYKMGFSLHGALTDKKDNLYNLDRLYVSNNNSMSDFVSILSTKSR